MTKIEEMARDFASHTYIEDGEIHTYVNELEKESYIKGATEQREIDLCLIAKWFKKNWRNYINTDADGMIRFAGWEKDLKDAMEK